MSDDSASLANDSQPTAVDNTGTGNAIAGITARESDTGTGGGVGRIGGGLTGGVDETGPATGRSGLAGEEPTNTDAEMGLGDIGTGTGGESATPTLGNGGEPEEALGGIGGTGVGGTGTQQGGGTGALSGGTGDIGGIGGTTVRDTGMTDSGGGTGPIGGVSGGPGTLDEGAIGAPDDEP